MLSDKSRGDNNQAEERKSAHMRLNIANEMPVRPIQVPLTCRRIISFRAPHLHDHDVTILVCFSTDSQADLIRVMLHKENILISAYDLL